MLNLDYKQAFGNVKNNLVSALQENFPIEGNKQKIVLNKVWVDDNIDALDFDAQKKIKLNKQSWTVPVYADISLVNKFTNKEVDRAKKFKLVNLPKITSRNTFIVDGTEYSVSNQFRLKPGVYTRVKANGELESQVNLAKGLNHKVIMNPETGVFNLNIKQANIPLYPIIKALGISDKEIKDQWGSKILTANQEKVGAVSGVKKLFKSVYNRSAESEDEAIAGVTEFLKKTEMSPDTTKLLLGKEFNKVTPKMWLLTSSKILRVNRGEEDPDDRDSLLFKELHSVENFVNERIVKGKSRIAGKIRNNIDKYPQLNKIVNIRYFNEPVRDLFTTSELSGVPSQFNPMNMINEQYKVTLMGEGGISSPYTIADETRNIHGSHLGFIDPINTPDTSKVGLTLHTTIQTIKEGKDIKTLVVNPESGKETYLNPAQFFEKIVAFPDQYEVVDGKVKFISKNVKVSYQGNIQEMSGDKVDYVLPSTKGIFSYSTNLIPFLSSTQGNRAVKGAKMIEQAISLSDREVPLVQSEAIPGESFVNMQGRNFAVYAPIPGKVSTIKDGKITIKGTKETRVIPFYDNFPLGQNNFINSELNVTVGDEVGKGQLIADTNFTKDGTLAIGKNLLTAYVPFKGYNTEDSIVISETAAKKLTSERLYRKETVLDENSVLKLSLFDAHYPDVLNPGTRKKLDEDGVIREGETVDYGDVLIAHLRLEEKTVEDVLLGRLTRVLYHPYKNRSVLWDLNTKGVVTQVIKRAGFVSVYVKTKEPMIVGDKMSPLQGGKGTVGLILPDKDMPRTKEGQPMEVLFNPHGIVSRMIPSQVMELSASKIAESKGSPYLTDNFADEDNLTKIKKELAAMGLTDQEELIDPESGKSIGKVLTGKNYFMKSFKETKTNLSARAQDGYDIDMQPIRGGHEGAKALDMLTFYSMLSHGAQANLHELGSYKSEKNDEYWRAIELGLPVPPPKQPFVFDKFVANLKALGVDPVRQGSSMTLFPMTDTKIKAMSHGNIEKGEFIRAKDLKPIKGGLFDPVITGGMRGCFHYSTPILTNKGNIRIGDIVNKKLIVEVASFNFKTRKVEYKPITNYFKNEGRLILIKSHYKALYCTPGHEFFVGLDKKKKSQDLKLKDHIYSYGKKFGPIQEQLIWSSLLGDSHLRCRKNNCYELIFTHSEKQKNYIKFKNEILKPFSNEIIPTLVDKKYERLSFSFNNFQLKEYHELCYPENKKTISIKWLSKINEMGLAFWYMDDGNFINFKENILGACLNTHCFQSEEIKLIQNWFVKKWGIKSYLKRNNERYGNKNYGYEMCFAGKECKKLFELMGPYIPNWMQYKLGKNKIFYYHECLLCGTKIKAAYDYCSNCLLEEVKKYPVSLHKFRKCSNISTTTIVDRFGSWKRAKTLVKNKTILTNDIPYYRDLFSTYGEKVDYLKSDYTIGLIKNRILSINKTPKTYWYGTSKTVYNIEVKDNHNYFAKGILVGNSNFSHFDLSEKIPNPLFEQPIKTILDLSASQYEDLISGDLKVDKDGNINPETGISGGDAFQLLLSKVKVDKRIDSLKEKAKGKRADQLDKINKELRYLTALKTSELKAEDAYLLNKVLILPPIYRPIYPLPSGDLMPSSLNMLYKHIHGANTKLGELKKLPEIEEKKNLRADLYKAVKALHGLGPPIASSLRKQELEGIIDFLAGSEPKTGFFQEKVLKKQQDIAGRATIVPGPNLGVNEIGLPEEIAWTMYRPFIMKEMVQQGYKPTEAEKRIEERDDLARLSLQVVLKERPLLLNRAPSLHKFSIMAFKPKVVSGKSIELPPLVTKGFNADFDGDAVNVFVPVSERAVKESFGLLPSKNLFGPGTGKVMLMPSQEAVIGLNLLTQPGKSLSTRYTSASDILKDFKNGRLNVDSMVKLDGKSISPGRIMVNNILPKKYHDLVIDKAALGKILIDVGKKDPEKYENLVGKLKNLGDEYAYRSGFSISLNDFDSLTGIRSKVLDKARSDITNIQKSRITDEKKEIKISDIYSQAAGDIDKEIAKDLPRSTNSLFKMVASGARGSVGQLRQTLVAPIAAQDAEGKNIPVLLDRSFSEGLPLSQYWTSMYGARQGIIGKSLQTAEPGALGKQIAASVLDNVVIEDDCGTREGLDFSLSNRESLNRYLVEPVVKGGRVLANRNDLVNTSLIDKLRQSGITEINVRSPLTCESKGTCSKCYGLDEFGKPPDIGTNIGIKAGQTISEPLSQGTLNIFHTGGVAAARKGPRGYERINQLLKMPEKVKGKATLAVTEGKVTEIAKSPAGGFDVFVQDKKYFVNPGRDLAVKKGDMVSPGDRLSTGAIKPQELVKFKGLRAVQDYLVDELHDVYREQNLPIDRKIFETVVSSVTNQSKIVSPGDHPNWLPGDYAPYSNVKAWNKKRLQEVDVNETKGMRLGQDYFQYPKGSETTDEILALLKDRGINKPLMELKPITHEPALAGINKLPLLRTDWLTRLGHSRLKNTILEASAKGYTSDIHGLSPIPSYIMGEERKV